jgi:hypothetical protein
LFFASAFCAPRVKSRQHGGDESLHERERGRE